MTAAPLDSNSPVLQLARGAGEPGAGRRRRPAPSGLRATKPAPQPTVSVIIPCYNYGRYLPDCVGSILSQPGVDVSILIIDDCSTDGSADMASALADVHTRVEVLRHRANRGHIATYNEGLEWATASYTLLISADDLLVPGALARAVNAFATYPTVGLVYGRAVQFQDGSERPRPRVSDGVVKFWPGSSWIDARCRFARTGIESPEVLMRTELQHSIGGYRSELPHTADMDMWMRAAHEADVAYVCADQAYLRKHPVSMSASQFGSLQLDYRQRQAAFETALLGNEHPLPEAEALYATARKALAADLLWRICRSYGAGTADSLPVDELIGLATDVYPDAAALPEMRALRRRRRLGRSARYLEPLALPMMAVRRVRRLRHQHGPLWWRHFGRP